MPLTFQPTKFATVNGRRNLVEKNPFKMISRDGTQIYIQKGQVYSSGGERLNVLPDWFEEEMAKQGKEGLDAVGWTEHRKIGRPATKELLEKKLAKKAEETKTAEISKDA